MKYWGEEKKIGAKFTRQHESLGALTCTSYNTEPVQEAIQFHDKEYVPRHSPVLLTVFAKVLAYKHYSPWLFENGLMDRVFSNQRPI